MNWKFVEEEDNNYSIHKQSILTLSQSCIATLANSIKYSYTPYLDTEDSVELVEDLLTQVVKYFHSNLFRPESNQPILPHWISDNLLFHFLHEQYVPDGVFTKLFSNTFCYLSKVEFNYPHKPHLSNRLSRVTTFNLTSLNLTHCDSITDSIFLSSSSSNMAKSLKILKVIRCKNFKRISSLHGFVNLTGLDLSENMLDFERMVPFKVLCSLVKSFPLLNSLNLHSTNLVQSFCEVHDCVLSELHEQLLSEVYSSLHLQELVLYTMVEFGEWDFFHLQLFYSALSEFTILTHLDLSGWPALDKIPEVTLSKLGKGLIFFGLYNTPLTQLGDSLSLQCNEIAGFANEYQILSSLQHYWSIVEYTDILYIRLFTAISNKRMTLSDDTALKLIPLILKSLDKEIDILWNNNKSGKATSTTLFLKCTASLYSILNKDLPQDVTTKVITSCIVLFNQTEIDNILTEGWSFLLRNICLIFAFLILDENRTNLTKEKICVTYKFIFKVIHKACDHSVWLESIDHHLSKLLTQVLRVFFYLICHRKSEEKTFVGQQLGGVSTLMRLVSVKFEQKQCNDHMRTAISSVMDLIYHSLPNCLELSQKVYSDLLVKIIEECSVDSNKLDVVDGIVALIENIAEFCLKDTRASVSYQMISPVLAVLRNPHKYKQDAVACAISISAYYRVGAEMWKWEENGEEALSLAVQAIHQIDYKTPRGFALDTLELLIECLKAKDDRVVLCAVWVICNLVYKKPDKYIKLLDENSFSLIRSISNSHPKDSQYYILSIEILHLNDITKRCAEILK